MTQDLVSGLAEELAYRYNCMKEAAIFRAIMKAEDGVMPHPSEMRVSGRFIVCSHDDYEEFQWRLVPMFQIRIRFKEHKATIEITDL
jgi:hypothetical protein